MRVFQIWRSGLRYLRNRYNFSDKEEMEYRWQKDNWSELFAQPEVREKCRQYWVTFRHLNEIVNLTGISDESAILDVGCGLSTVLHYVNGKKYGIDPLAARYKAIYAYPSEMEIRTGYGESIPFPNATFDVVFCSNCIDHTRNPRATITEISRVLKPAGFFVLTCETFDQDRGERNLAHPYSMTTTALDKLTYGWEEIANWESPWYGLQRFVQGLSPTPQRETIRVMKIKQSV